MLNLHRDKKIVRREPGRDVVTTGRMVMMKSIGYKSRRFFYTAVPAGNEIIQHQQRSKAIPGT